MNRFGLIIACGVALAASTANAQVGAVNYTAGSKVSFPPAAHPVTYDMGAGQGRKTSAVSGSDFNSFVTIAKDNVSFESSNAVSGPFVRTTSTSTVLIDFDNPTGKAATFESTITPAGLGFYLADTRGGCLYSDCPQISSLSTFGLKDLMLPGTSKGVLGTVGFDFEVLSGEESLYHVAGQLSLTYNLGHKGLYVDDGLGTARAVLDDFSQVTPFGSNTAIGYAWDNTRIAFGIGNAAHQTLTYRTSVYSMSNTTCRAQYTCLVAYSGFGDPIGRGGGADFALKSLRAGPHVAALGSHAIDGVTFSPASFRLPAFNPATGVLSFVSTGSGVPEPATWMSLILGFGLLGAAMRRRLAAVA